MWEYVWVTTYMHSQNLKVLKYVGDEKKAEWGKHWIEQGFNGTDGMAGRVACGGRRGVMPVSGTVIYV